MGLGWKCVGSSGWDLVEDVLGRAGGTVLEVCWGRQLGLVFECVWGQRFGLSWRYIGDSMWYLFGDMWGTASGTGVDICWGEDVGLVWRCVGDRWYWVGDVCGDSRKSSFGHVFGHRIWDYFGVVLWDPGWAVLKKCWGEHVGFLWRYVRDIR